MGSKDSVAKLDALTVATEPRFGARGDGSTNDTVALQAFLDAGGGHLPAGTFMVTALAASASFVLWGEGTIKQIASTAADMLTISGTSTQARIRGVTLDGNQANQAAETDWATVKITAVGTASVPCIFEFDSVTFVNGAWADLTLKNDAARTTVDKLIVRGCRFLAGREGTTQADDTRYLDIRSPIDYIVTGCVFDFMGTPAIYGRAGILAYDGHSTTLLSARGVISGNHLVNVGRSQTNSTLGAIDTYSRGRSTTIVGNTLVNPYGRGIQCKSDSAGVLITGNAVDGLSGGLDGTMNAQITVNASTNTSYAGFISITGNTCIDSGNDGISVTHSNSNDTGFANGVVISSNAISNATRRAIGVGDCHNLTIVNNTIDGGVTGIYIQGAEGPVLIGQNMIRACTGIGVQIPNLSPDATLKIINNMIEGTGGRGIYLASGARGRISGNTVLDAGATGIEVANTTGVVRVDGNMSNVDPPFADGGSNSALRIGVNDWETPLTFTAKIVTIAGGSISITMDRHWVNTESDAATDDLDTISGGYDDQRLVLQAAYVDRTVVVKDGTQLRLNGDMTLDNLQDTLTLRYDAVSDTWFEIGRSDNNT